MIIEANSSSFEQLIGKGITLVKFTADWCTYCRMIEPMLQQLAQELDGKATVAELNTDYNSELTASYDVMAIPTVIIFKDGKEMKRMVNVQNKEEYLRVVDELLTM